MNSVIVSLATASAVLAPSLLLAGCAGAPRWSHEQRAVLQDLRLAPTPAPPDRSNRFADSEAAARLGQRFFFDRRFSSNGAVSCASCHIPEQTFQDSRPLARGVGTTNRRTMPIAGADASPWFFWDGRKDSLWSQALGPLESEVEHGGDRVQYVRLIASSYRQDFERVFGALPDLSGLPEHASPAGGGALWDAWSSIPAQQQESVNSVFANLGKAIAAYERKLQPGPSRFDRFVEAVMRDDAEAARKALDREEEAGLRLFIGKARCTQCHNGPLFTNNDFANTGVPSVAALPDDAGRLAGASEVLQDEFNCLGAYSDAKPEDCRELKSLRLNQAQAVRQFKVPSLRNVSERAPFMHAGQLATLAEVLDHYNRAPAPPAGHSELRPLGLSPVELRQLARFLGALSAPLQAEPAWLSPPAQTEGRIRRP
jgi:cytochrome c peroxidase